MKVLDLFCGAGGAAMGIHRAWPEAEIVGVDLKQQPRYPFKFVQADAMTFPLDGYDFIWASPPCQSYSSAMKHLAKPHPKLIDDVRSRLSAAGVPYIIENVPGASMINHIVLCGTMFGLRIHRHRLFECPGLFLLVPECFTSKPVLNPHRSSSRDRMYAEFGRQNLEKLWGKEMGVPWMNKQETREAIPPAYSEFLCKHLPR